MAPLIREYTEFGLFHEAIYGYMNKLMKEIMARGYEHRRRTLEVLAILERETDTDHRLTLSQLMEIIGMDPDDGNQRRKLRGDLAAIREMGYPLRCERHKAPEYYLYRRFSSKELKMLVDLVEGARTIPQEMSDTMVESILSLGSGFEAKSVKSKIRVRNRVKLFNDELVDNIWEIKRAIEERRKIRFRYFNYGFDFERIYHSEGTVESPLVLTYTDGAHYVVTYSEDVDDKRHRRVDRMTDVTVLDEKATWKGELQCYEIDESTLFNMFAGREELVTLTANERAMNALIDRFGHNMEISNVREVANGGVTERYADVRVRVAESKQFEGWLKGLEDILWRKEDSPV